MMESIHLLSGRIFKLFLNKLVLTSIPGTITAICSMDSGFLCGQEKCVPVTVNGAVANSHSDALLESSSSGNVD
jgi:hypothetical protein